MGRGETQILETLGEGVALRSPRVEAALAGAEDIPALRELKLEVVRRTYAEFEGPALREWEERFCSERYLAERIPARPNERGEISYFYVAGPRQRPEGMAALKLRDGKAYLGDIYVRRPRRGLGTRLLLGMLEAARDEHGLRVAVADCFSSNEPCLRWLQKHGFEIASGYEEGSLGVWVHRLEREL